MADHKTTGTLKINKTIAAELKLRLQLIFSLNRGGWRRDQNPK